MKKVFSLSNLGLVALAVCMTLVPETALAQNPILEGMKTSAAMTITKTAIVVVALLIFGSQTIPALMDGDGAKVLKSILGVGALLALAIKLSDVISLFSSIA